MNTHIKPLIDDLTAVSVLIGNDGERIKPIAWQGETAGGHHRKGVLQFAAPPNKPKVIELQMRGFGGADMRAFRWELV
jgi:hypothetical protein